MTCTMASCGNCGRCSEPWDDEQQPEPFTCIRCGVECDLDNHVPFCSLVCAAAADAEKPLQVVLCRCGCGLPAPIAFENRPSWGHVKGKPISFIRGHHRRGVRQHRLVRTRGYRSAGNTRLHRERAERALGKPLPPGAVVHHADGSRNDDAPLVICQDIAYHKLLHVRMAIIAAGGDPNTERVCGQCKAVKPLTDFTPQMSKCRVCRAANAREKYNRSRNNYDGPQDTEAWSGGFASNH